MSGVGADAPASGSFDCLWCGRSFAPRSATDLEAWARLCPDCLGRAQTNPFLKARLRAGLEARAAATAGRPDARPADAGSSIEAEMVRYYAARAREYDDWYLRRGRYARGPIHDAAWQADLEAAATWLERLPFRGEIVELAAGTGWWSPLLARKGSLWLYDAAPEPLELARERLLAHGLRAHLHVRDAWAEPDRRVDGVFAGFWLSHVAAARLEEFLGLVARWLVPGGLFAFVDSRPDPQSGAFDQEPPQDGMQLRRLADGSTFRVRKVFHEAATLEAGLRRAGFPAPLVGRTSRFFLLGSARLGSPAP